MEVSIGGALALAGFAQVICGFLFFRQPGVAFFARAPIRRASQYLTPPGVALWFGGLSIALVGTILMLIQYFQLIQAIRAT